jgi:hypothetical protein
MRDADYSAVTAATPKKLTTSKVLASRSRG